MWRMMMNFLSLVRNELSFQFCLKIEKSISCSLLTHVNVPMQTFLWCCSPTLLTLSLALRPTTNGQSWMVGRCQWCCLRQDKKVGKKGIISCSGLAVHKWTHCFSRPMQASHSSANGLHELWRSYWVHGFDLRQVDQHEVLFWREPLQSQWSRTEWVIYSFCFMDSSTVFLLLTLANSQSLNSMLSAVTVPMLTMESGLLSIFQQFWRLWWILFLRAMLFILLMNSGHKLNLWGGHKII